MTISEGDFFMIRTMVYHRKKIWVVFLICIMLLLGLVGRLWYLMNVREEYYSKKAEDLHERITFSGSLIWLCITDTVQTVRLSARIFPLVQDLSPGRFYVTFPLMKILRLF